MTDSEFVEMAAGLPTSSEVDGSGGPDTPAAYATLDSMIGVARNITAQAFAPEEGFTAAQLFDELGDKIMSLDRDSLVFARHWNQEVLVESITFRDDAVVLDIADAAKGD